MTMRILSYRRAPRRLPLTLLLPLALALLISALPAARPAPVPAPHVFAPPAPADAGAETLPPSLLARPELVDRRDEYARHFDMGNGQFVAVVGLEPLNYRDARGQWQPIQPAFAPSGDGWQVMANSLHNTFAGRGTATQIEGGGIAIGWQPRALTARAADGATRELATPLQPAQAAPGALVGANTLRYGGAWSDPSFVEQFHSSAGALKQELVLAHRPVVGGAEWLELRVELALPADAQVFADGALQNGDVETHDALEIRTAQGAPALVFQPSVAYEQADPARHFPAVLDPAIQVFKASVDGATVFDEQTGVKLFTPAASSSSNSKVA